VLAEDKGYEHGMVYADNFKGRDFMPNVKPKEARGMMLDPGVKYVNERRVDIADHNGQRIDIRPYDPDINFTEDNTILDGEFQDEGYWGHRIQDIDEWLKVEPLDMPDDLCVIGFRGGEFRAIPDLFLPKQYWDKAILGIKLENPDMKFQVHTDDPETARQFFPECEVIHDMELNWRSVRYAKWLIIANSSFYILPAMLNQSVKQIIAPRYWARRNIGLWALPQKYYKKFTYI
jgi:hypothetical protein